MSRVQGISCSRLRQAGHADNTFQVDYYIQTPVRLGLAWGRIYIFQESTGKSTQATWRFGSFLTLKTIQGFFLGVCRWLFRKLDRSKAPGGLGVCETSQYGYSKAIEKGCTRTYTALFRLLVWGSGGRLVMCDVWKGDFCRGKPVSREGSR